MTRWFYSYLMWLAQPLLRRKLQRRGQQEPGYRQAIPERFGHYRVAAQHLACGRAERNTWPGAMHLAG